MVSKLGLDLVGPCIGLETIFCGLDLGLVGSGLGLGLVSPGLGLVGRGLGIVGSGLVNITGYPKRKFLR